MLQGGGVIARFAPGHMNRCSMTARLPVYCQEFESIDTWEFASRRLRKMRAATEHKLMPICGMRQHTTNGQVDAADPVKGISSPSLVALQDAGLVFPIT